MISSGPGSAKGPTAVDRQWADIYVRLGADRNNVAALLADEG